MDEVRHPPTRPYLLKDIQAVGRKLHITAIRAEIDLFMGLIDDRLAELTDLLTDYGTQSSPTPPDSSDSSRE